MSFFILFKFKFIHGLMFYELVKILFAKVERELVLSILHQK